MTRRWWNDEGELTRLEIDGVEHEITDEIRARHKPPEGRGDRIERKLKPLVDAIDKATGSKLSGCGGCKKQRDRINAGMTLVESTKLRIIEFAGDKLTKAQRRLLKSVHERLKRQEHGIK